MLEKRWYFIYICFFESDNVLSRHSIDDPIVDEDIFCCCGPAVPAYSVKIGGLSVPSEG
jgi:hypothetical protein